ncbi:MAG: helix-turn-helix transcriptional regulator [Candidatus Omnitrophica bacterium]|nr:helix-turn-helix transcriptional regulator [Candidatus Omnitrophota bacterium]
MEKELEEWSRLHKFYEYADYQTKDLADYLNVSPRTIQRWIKGKTAPSRQQLERIRKYLTEKTLKKSPEDL